MKEEMEILVRELKCNNSIIERSVEFQLVILRTAEMTLTLFNLGFFFCSLGAANSAEALDPNFTRPSTM